MERKSISLANNKSTLNNKRLRMAIAGVLIGSGVLAAGTYASQEHPSKDSETTQEDPNFNNNPNYDSSAVPRSWPVPPKIPLPPPDILSPEEWK